MHEQLPTIERRELDTVTGGLYEQIRRGAELVWNLVTGQRPPPTSFYPPTGCVGPTPRR
jgi:hypothetical protein